MSRLAGLLFLVLPLSACAQTGTIRELGHPAFESVVGADTQLELMEGAPKGELVAFTDDVRMDADHRWIFGAIPTGTTDDVLLEVRAASRPPSGLALKTLAVAVFPLTLQQAAEFSRTGKVPAPESPIAFESTSELQTLPNDQQVMIVNVKIARSALPPDTERLAATVLAQLEDGFVHARFYQTGVPVPQDQPNEPPLEVTPPPAEEAPPTPGDAPR